MMPSLTSALRLIAFQVNVRKLGINFLPFLPPVGDCLVIPFGHCERPRLSGRAWQSNYFSISYELASVVSLLRNDITTQSLGGGGRNPVILPGC